MGVGAKASTPIEFNRQNTIQYENNNEQENNNFTYTIDPSWGQTFGTWQRSPIVDPGLDNWSWQQTTGTTTQYTFADWLYTQDHLHYDETNANDTFEYKLDTFESTESWTTEKVEVLSVTPTMIVSETTLTKNIGTRLVTKENINADFTISLDIYYSNTGSLDSFKGYYTGDNAAPIVDDYRRNINNIPMYAYTYEHRELLVTIDENTSAEGTWESFTFNIPLVNNTNTVMVMFYKIVCTNIATQGSNARVYDVVSTENNGIYSQAIRTNITTISGNWSTAEVHQEVIDLPGLMWTILSMPFSFISTAFNLTLFPGTPYSLNLTNLFMALILMAIIVFILKKVMKI